MIRPERAASVNHLSELWKDEDDSILNEITLEEP